jgi:hypothetical protein
MLGGTIWGVAAIFLVVSLNHICGGIEICQPPNSNEKVLALIVISVGAVIALMSASPTENQTKQICQLVIGVAAGTAALFAIQPESFLDHVLMLVSILPVLVAFGAILLKAFANSWPVLALLILGVAMVWLPAIVLQTGLFEQLPQCVQDEITNRPILLATVQSLMAGLGLLLALAGWWQDRTQRRVDDSGSGTSSVSSAP